jgi:hypothetical protein
MGWHVELQIPVDRLADVPGIVRSLDVPVVIDHMGRPAAGAIDPKSPALAELVCLVRDQRCFVKLSAPYRLSAEAALAGCNAARAETHRRQSVGVPLGHELAARRYRAIGGHARHDCRAGSLVRRHVNPEPGRRRGGRAAVRVTARGSRNPSPTADRRS